MMLRKGKDRQKKDKRKKRKTPGQIASDMVRAQKNRKENLYDA